MGPQKQSRLEGIVKELLLGISLFLGTGCGIIHYDYDEMVKRGNIVAPKDFDLDRKLTKANRSLMRFPTAEQINQEIGVDVVKSVDKYLIPGASKLLIHGRQEHFKAGISEEKIKRVMDVQTEIYLSSDYFRRHKHVKLRRAHDEGITSEVWAQIFIRYFRIIDDIDRYHADILKEDIKSIEYKLTVNPEDKLIRILEEKRKKLGRVQQVREEMVLYGAILKLGAEGKLKVLPAEKERRKYKKESDLKDEMREIDLKEDIFLEIAARLRYYRVYVVFGGAHAWGGNTSCGDDYDLSGRLSRKDNLAAWNQENPENQFSLIEITFQSYDEQKDKIKDIKKHIENQD